METFNNSSISSLNFFHIFAQNKRLTKSQLQKSKNMNIYASKIVIWFSQT
ncbi:hypothetical protein Hanom_Chr09g00769651 [Helianthus anomalus]